MMFDKQSERRIRTRFNGTCKWCKHPYHINDVVVLLRPKGARHAVCPTDEQARQKELEDF